MAVAAQPRRFLVVSNDVVGRAMAGPGIRYFHFARELARRHDVTLLVPELADVDLDGVDVRSWRGLRRRDLVALFATRDAVVAQHLPPLVMRDLARLPVRVVYDLYDPYLIENLPFYAADAAGAAERAELRAGALLQEIALATGDGFICASERQRDLWLGMLAALDRVDLETYRRDEELRGLIDVVPFGLEPEPPHSTRPVVKGVVRGVGHDDKVLLWGGGVWNWLDPLTPIRAVARLAERRDDVKLYFLGLERPNPDVARMAMAQRAVELADDLGVRDRHVFFNFGWVPYAERADYLTEADLGITAHLNTVEARFAFRTRVVDYLWARVPVLATRGDALAELVGERGLGRELDFGDVDGWVSAIEELLDGAEGYAAAQARIDEVRADFAWPTVVERLARLLEAPVHPAAGSRRANALVLRHLWLRARVVRERTGLVGVARYAAVAVGAKAGLLKPRQNSARR